MIKKKLEEILPGMVIAEEVYSNDKQQLLLEKGQVLATEQIQKLIVWDIDDVMIDAELEDMTEQIERREQMLKKIFIETHTKAVQLSQTMLGSIETGDPIVEAEVITTVHEMIDKLTIDRNVLLSLTHIKTVDNYLFAHSVNTCVISLVIGKHLEYNEDQLTDLGNGAFLHDVGMMRISRHIWDHPLILTDTQKAEIRRHPEIGAEMLRETPGVPEAVIRTVLEHHERMDGSGYPRGLQGEEIHEYARIVGIADVYEALITRRKHRDKKLPPEAIKTILETKDKLFDSRIMRAFVGNMAVYPIGTLVKLSTKEIARVVGTTRNKPFRPHVKVLFDRDGNRLQHGSRINLAEEKNWKIFIHETLDDRIMEVELGDDLFA